MPTGRQRVFQLVEQWEVTHEQLGTITIPQTANSEVTESDVMYSESGWSCKICARAFPSEWSVKEHLKSGRHEPRRYRCQVCKRTHFDLTGFSNHLDVRCKKAILEPKLLDAIVNELLVAKNLPPIASLSSSELGFLQFSGKSALTEVTPSTSPDDKLFYPIAHMQSDFDPCQLFFSGCAPSRRGDCSGAAWRLFSKGSSVNILQGKSLPSIQEPFAGLLTEYEALLCGLEVALSKGIRSLMVKSDSQMVVKLMRGEWAVDTPVVMWHHNRCCELSSQFDWCDIEWIPAVQNRVCIDEALKYSCGQF